MHCEIHTCDLAGYEKQPSPLAFKLSVLHSSGSWKNLQLPFSFEGYQQGVERKNVKLEELTSSVSTGKDRPLFQGPTPFSLRNHGPWNFSPFGEFPGRNLSYTL